MGGSGAGGGRRLASGLVAAAVISTSLTVTVSLADASVGLQEADDHLDELEALQDYVEPDPVPWEDSTYGSLFPEVSDDLQGSVEPVEATEFPAPGVWEVTLGDPEVSEPIADGPVHASTDDTEDVVGEQLRVEVLDQATAERVGASGFVFNVSDAVSDGAGVVSAAIESGTALPVELSIDYSAFAGAYGGDYVERLQVMALPECALVDPVPADCDATARMMLPVRLVSRPGFGGDFRALVRGSRLAPAGDSMHGWVGWRESACSCW